MPGNDGTPEVCEEGDIFFLYRPKVNEDEPSSRSDVQRFYMVLRPRGESLYRLMVIGRKMLPDVERHDREWGFVDMVTGDPGRIEEALREETYRTGTRGEQRQPAARPAGEGVYVVTLQDGQMHLSYALELPEKPSAVQREFKIAPEASFAISVKNPEKGQPRTAGLAKEAKAEYPKDLQQEFRGRRFAREDVRLLNTAGAEFVLVGARDNPEAAYDISLDTEREDYSHAETIRNLRMRKSRHPVKPLFQGGWA